MSEDGAAIENRERTNSVDDALPSSWRVALGVVGATFAGIVLLYFSTFQSIVSIWSRSGTFAHGFLILPISLYLIWDERANLRALSPRPDWRVLPLLAIVGFAWLGCRMAGVLVLEQYLAVAAIPVAIWVVVGNAVMRQLAFPLGFLLLGVPVGEALIPPLIDFTAAFTVAGLRLTGVPVLRNGNLLTLASSQWSVVEACSGLRYLIACITLGLLYAHLTYRTWWRRGLCVLASVIVPIVANGFRAYMIVMLGHLSDMRLAVGIDHLIYGWLFFGFVVFVFFWVGSFFREDNLEASKPVVEKEVPTAVTGRRFIVAGITAVLVAAVWPVWANQAERFAFELPSPPPYPLPIAFGEWSSISVAPTNWQPHYVGADVSLARHYERHGEWVGVHVACYAAQQQGSELVNSSNLLVPPHGSWRRVTTRVRAVTLEARVLETMESMLESREATVVAWKWYWVDGQNTVSPYYAKLLEMAGKLTGRPPLACGIVAYTNGGDSAAPRLTEFLNQALPDIEAGVDALPRAE